jgi:hypothetical protein
VAIKIKEMLQEDTLNMTEYMRVWLPENVQISLSSLMEHNLYRN